MVVSFHFILFSGNWSKYGAHYCRINCLYCTCVNFQCNCTAVPYNYITINIWEYKHRGHNLVVK